MPITNWIDLSPRELLEAVTNIDKKSIKEGIPVDLIRERLSFYAPKKEEFAVALGNFKEVVRRSQIKHKRKVS